MTFEQYSVVPFLKQVKQQSAHLPKTPVVFTRPVLSSKITRSSALTKKQNPEAVVDPLLHTGRYYPHGYPGVSPDPEESQIEVLTIAAERLVDLPRNEEIICGCHRHPAVDARFLPTYNASRRISVMLLEVCVPCLRSELPN
jgi:hypothetical protein